MINLIGIINYNPAGVFCGRWLAYRGSFPSSHFSESKGRKSLKIERSKLFINGRNFKVLKLYVLQYVLIVIEK